MCPPKLASVTGCSREPELRSAQPACHSGEWHYVPRLPSLSRVHSVAVDSLLPVGPRSCVSTTCTGNTGTTVTDVSHTLTHVFPVALQSFLHVFFAAEVHEDTP